VARPGLIRGVLRDEHRISDRLRVGRGGSPTLAGSAAIPREALSPLDWLADTFKMSHPVASSRLALAAIAVSFLVTGLLQFAISDWSQLGLGYVYLLPVVIAGLWFGARPAALVGGAATALVTIWYASVPNTPTVATEATSLTIRAAAYVGVGIVVGVYSERLRGMAYADALTGLPNRRALIEWVGRLIADRCPFGVLIFDVDDLKGINDSQGHEAGDAAINRVAVDLQLMLGRNAFVARVGGDEFVAVISSARALELRLHGLTIPGASSGCALYPDDGGTLDAVMACADLELYRQKQTHRPTARSSARDSFCRDEPH
jgi:GGDEF domain-containing protein